MNKQLILVDGSSFLYRAYYSMRPLHAPNGQPVQAVYGFCRMLKKLIGQFEPSYCALVWDSKGPTVRHQLFADYKATRQAPPSDLFEQKKYIKTFADLIGLSQIERESTEADDLMFALAKKFQSQGFEIILITSDKDLCQVLAEHVTIYDPFKDVHITVKSFEQERSFSVAKIPFYHALLGDASDNIPGVKGIGKKGALDLVQQFDSLEDLYAHLDQVRSVRTQKLLQQQRENAFLSYELFLLRDITLEATEQNLIFDKNNWVNARPLFAEFQFKSLFADLGADQIGQMVVAHSEPPLVTSKGYVFEAVTTAQALDACIQEIKTAKIFALDTETDGLHPLSSALVGFSVCCKPGHAWYIPLIHAHELVLPTPDVWVQFKPLLEDESFQKILHNAKFDQLVLYNAGINLRGVIFDTMVAASLVQPEWQKVGLKALSIQYFNERMLTFNDVVKANNYTDFSCVPLPLAAQYAAADAHQTLRLWNVLKEKLTEFGLADVYYTIEHPLIDVLVSMEREGILCDSTVLAHLDQHVSHALRTFEQEIHIQSGLMPGALNLNSPKQLEQLLFGTLQLPPKKKSAKKTGYSTDAQVLQELAHLHIVPRLIMRHRELFKLKSSYIDALPAVINPKTKKIHTSFNQVAVATGRLASSEPNLQNIPVADDLSIRSAFYAPDGYQFVSADYSQIELRVLAYLSGDLCLKQAFAHELDIHRQTAAKIFDVEPEQVTSEQRTVGKRINFSIMYGQSPYGLSRDLGIGSAQAKEYIDKYFAQYPGVRAWMEKVIEHTKQTGYTKTWLGRRRAVPGIYEKNKHLYEAACRIAVNTPAQGTAAEIMKLGMLNLHRVLVQEHVPAALVLQIHDEVLVVAQQESVARVQHILKQSLESVVTWDVPLKVTMRTGRTWHEVTK